MHTSRHIITATCSSRSPRFGVLSSCSSWQSRKRAGWCQNVGSENMRRFLGTTTKTTEPATTSDETKGNGSGGQKEEELEKLGNMHIKGFWEFRPQQKDEKEHYRRKPDPNLTLNEQVREGLNELRRQRNITILGGVHGNEIVGVNVVKRLAKAFTEELEIENGKLTLGLGNLKAIETKTRGTSPSLDLNRMFRPEIVLKPASSRSNLKKDKGGTFTEDELESYEFERASEIFPVLAESDIFVDIHATNKPSEPFIRIAGVCNESELEVASWYVNLENDKKNGRMKLLLDPLYVLGGSICTTDEFAGSFGNAAICLETGIFDDTKTEDTVYQRSLEMLNFYLGVKRKEKEEEKEEEVEMEKQEDSNENNDKIKKKKMKKEPPLFPLKWKADVLENEIITPQEFGTSIIFSEIDDGRVQDLPLELRRKVIDTTEGSVIPFEIQNWYDRIFSPYELISAHFLTEKGFQFEPGFGKENWQMVRAGDTIGLPEKRTADKTVLVDLYVSRTDAVILFPKVKELWQHFKPLYWLAKRVNLSYQSSESNQMVSLVSSRENPSIAQLLRWRRSSISRNQDLFLSFLHSGKPGITRKKGKTNFEVIAPQNIEHARENPLQAEAISKVSIAHSLHGGIKRPGGFNIHVALDAIKTAQLQARATNTLPTYKRDARELLHYEDGVKYPLNVYPTSYRVEGQFYARGWEPFYSPRIEINFPVHQILSDGDLYLGIEMPDPEEFEITRNRIDELAGDMCLQTMELDERLFVNCPVKGSAYILSERSSSVESATSDSVFVYVAGRSKSDVGSTFYNLGRVLDSLSKVRPSRQASLQEYHPLFNAQGDLVATYGFKQQLFAFQQVS